MANCMKEVAQVLGVELGEEFRIKGIRSSVLFKISERGLVSHCLGSNDWATDELMLVRLLIGDFAEIVKLPRKPQIREKYYVPRIAIRPDDRYYWYHWQNSDADIKRYDMGIVCKTKEEAVALTKKMLMVVTSE